MKPVLHGGVRPEDRFLLVPGTIIAGYQVQRDGSFIRLMPGKTYRDPVTGTQYRMRDDGTLELMRDN